MNSIVNAKESEALKEMIFKRVRERSQAMSEDVQTDVMDMARNSFVSENNPFSKIVEKPEVEPSKQADIGFPVKKPDFARAERQSAVISEQVATQAVQSTMIEAREALSNKKSFMGALNFLNSQAAVSLIRTRADKFEIVV